MTPAVVFYGSTSVPVFAGQLLDRDSSLPRRSPDLNREKAGSLTLYLNCLSIIANRVKK